MQMLIQENAILILRVLEENGIIMGSHMINADIMSQTGLDEESYDKADSYLLQKRYIEGGGSGVNAQRWLTDSGISFLEQTMYRRLPLSTDAEKILIYLIHSTIGKFETIERSKIIKALKLNDARYNAAVNILLDFELVRKGGGGGVINLGTCESQFTEERLGSTQEGRQAVHRGFLDPQSISHASQIINIHALSNIQAIANAINSQIEQQVVQTITENDPEVLKEMVAELLQILVALANESLTQNDQEKYIEAAANIQKELDKSNPEVEIIKKWIVRLSFLDSAFTVGDKAISLCSKALPTVMLLAKIAEGLMGK
jgi:hypothetical protein